MAMQMTDRLDTLYVAAIDRDASLMHANAVSACARWCGAKTTQAQLQEFVNRQIASLEGLDDSLTIEIRGSWEWLAGEIGAVPMAAPVAEPVRLFSRFTSRKSVAAPSLGVARESVAASSFGAARDSIAA